MDFQNFFFFGRLKIERRSLHIYGLKTVYALVEYYEEFFNDTMINKEDVSFVKIGPGLRGSKIDCMSFSVIGLMCSHLTLPCPTPITVRNFPFLLATQFRQRMYCDRCHWEKKSKCKSTSTSCCRTA